MSKHPADLTSTALRDLDPARATELTEPERQHAEAVFARIVATPTDDPVPTEPTRPARRRLLLIPAGLAAAGVVSALLLGGSSAFASWTPRPEPLSATEGAAAATTCRDRMGLSDEADRVLIAERRGGWTYVLVSGPQEEGSCLMLNDVVGKTGSATVGHLLGGGGVVDYEVPKPAPDRVEEFDSIVSSYNPRPWWWFSDPEFWGLAGGYVGSDVVGVTVHTPAGLDVEASVANGRFAAWFPGGDRVDPEDDPWTTDAWTYTLTLRDGTTRPATG
ncbi:MAG TPA: hypothetical protein VIP77_06815 [Jiangellaceae bacterium]